MSGLGKSNGFGRYATGSWLPMEHRGAKYFEPDGLEIVATVEFRSATKDEIAAEMTARGEARIGFPPAAP